MTIADMVYSQVKQLPEPLAREVLDFTGFLRESRDRAEWRDLTNAQATGLAAVWDNPEDAVWDHVRARGSAARPVPVHRSVGRIIQLSFATSHRVARMRAR